MSKCLLQHASHMYAACMWLTRSRYIQSGNRKSIAGKACACTGSPKSHVHALGCLLPKDDTVMIESTVGALGCLLPTGGTVVCQGSTVVVEGTEGYQWVVGCPGAVDSQRCTVEPSNSTSNQQAIPCTTHGLPAVQCNPFHVSVCCVTDEAPAWCRAIILPCTTAGLPISANVAISP